MWISTLENSTLLHAENKGTDQPAHMRSLISAFVIHILESIKSKLDMSEISIFQLVSEQVGFGMAWSKTPKTGFLTMRCMFLGLHSVYKKHLLSTFSSEDFPCWG